MAESKPQRQRLLIEEWLPIAAIGIESLRERTPMTPFPAPNRLHVWFARRPLVASRAAILASLLPGDVDRATFLHILGIHGDSAQASKAVAAARQTGVRVTNPYGYDRAFSYTPTEEERTWLLGCSERAGFKGVTILDPTAGGGSIPFEALRLGLDAIANDLNSVAWLILKATTELPVRFGQPLYDRYVAVSTRYMRMLKPLLYPLFPRPAEENVEDATYLWARTITCPYCGGLIPLSPNWKLDSEGTGVRLHPQKDEGPRIVSFEIVESARDHSEGTVNDGIGLCPFEDCARTIDGDEIKRQAQLGQMGQQLYCVVYKRESVTGWTKAGKAKKKSIRGFRAPRQEDDVADLVRARLAKRMPGWLARDIMPDEAFPQNTNDDRPLQYGMPLWRDMFSPRQLFGHCTSVEVFQDLLDELIEEGNGSLADLDRAALCYVAIALDKILNYNAYQVRWHPNREVVAGVFDRHDFSHKWSFAEMAPTMTGLGYDWAIEQTSKSLRELIDLLGVKTGTVDLFDRAGSAGSVDVRCSSADNLQLADASVDCIVMDPPYYNNVMYAELSDFFYVWLKRTAGRLYPEGFLSPLTDKDHEAVANPARFSGEKQAGARAQLDYQKRMASIFREQRRVLKPSGVMTVMFTHKASGAWDALAGGLIDAGFMITASWPINTEAEGSLHIRERSAAKSTIFLVCRVRDEEPVGAPRYWEDVEPLVAAAVRKRVAEFQDAGIGGVDLYLASFGPALQVFSEAWPLTRGRALPSPTKKQKELFSEWDPYAVRPEDALLSARREVKNWRMQQLATVLRQHHLDALTEWFVLAWDAFRAPRFPSDEGLKLARVVGLDFDQSVKKVVCEVKGDDLIMWDSKTRQLKGTLGKVGADCMLDVLHRAALTGREQNTGAARNLLEMAGLLNDPTLLTALEALLNVLPSATPKKDAVLGGASSDFQALEKLRRLAFSEEIPAPKIAEQAAIELEPGLEIE